MQIDPSVQIRLVSTSPEALDIATRAVNSLYPLAHFGMMVKEDSERYARSAWIRIKPMRALDLFEDEDTQPLKPLS